jgi:uncharacterized protein involved in exopolysaccharide biosynthesis
MDPASALGLASRIVQLIQFTNGLISKDNEIYKSTQGSLLENLELETITASLADFLKELPLELTNNGSRRLTKTEKQIQDLCQGYNAISIQLLGVMGELKTKRPSTYWKSFC